MDKNKFMEILYRVEEFLFNILNRKRLIIILIVGVILIVAGGLLNTVFFDHYVFLFGDMSLKNEQMTRIYGEVITVDNIIIHNFKWSWLFFGPGTVLYIIGIILAVISVFLLFHFKGLTNVNYDENDPV